MKKLKTKIFVLEIDFLEFAEMWCSRKARKIRKNYYKWSIKASGGEK